MAPSRNNFWKALCLISVALNVVLLWQVNRVQSKPSITANGVVPGVGRALSSSNSQNDNQGGSSSHGHEGPHQHDALFFLFKSLVIGSAVLHASMYYHSLQTTVVLFVIGIVFAVVLESLKIKEDIGIIGDSYMMWLGIDPHLLLFTLLPVLLAGDAMKIDTSVARHVGLQCLYLAGPGVFISALIVACFLMLYLGWGFLLSLVTSSILCATDPVAVVALLKELGASPKLTIQIQGESLLNDGTAIVLYMVSYRMLSGEEYDVLDIILFLVKTAGVAWGLGMFIGYFFVSWIRIAANKFEHNSSIIQISLTLCCAYWSFLLAEGVLKISGVLATVAASLMMANLMWPHVISQDSMDHVWHMFESLANMLIFFLAGTLTGETMVHIEAVDYLHLFVLYIVITLVRGGLIFASRPVLRYLDMYGLPVSVADAAVMTWGGLRGAVGLALAIQVHNDRAPDSNGAPQIDPRDGQRVMFFVSGIALLTIVLNATTAPALVKLLGITALPDAQLKLLKLLMQQLVNSSRTSVIPEKYTHQLTHMIDHIEHDVAELLGIGENNNLTRFASRVTANLGPLASRLSTNVPGPCGEGPPDSPPEMQYDSVTPINVSPTPSLDGPNADDARSSARSSTKGDNSNLVRRLRAAEAVFELLEVGDLGMLCHSNEGGGVSKGLPPDSLLGKVSDMASFVEFMIPNEEMAKVINQAFLGLVHAHYWKQLKSRDLVPGSEETKILLTSIQVALSPLNKDLVDFDFIIQSLRKARGPSHTLHTWQPLSDDIKYVKKFSQVQEPRRTVMHVVYAERKWLAKFVISTRFNLMMAGVVVVNGVLIICEEAVRGSTNEVNVMWLISEMLFTLIFVIEFMIKFFVMRCEYFKDVSNGFDFALVVVNVFSVALSITVNEEEGKTNNTIDLAAAVRLTRILRALRLLRLLRLFYAKLDPGTDVSLDLAGRMLRINVFMSFIGAHTSSQQALLKYFCGNGLVDVVEEAEIARAILQSQVAVYKAIEFVMSEEKSLDNNVVEEVKWVYERKEIVEGLEDFIMSAHEDGAINAREAESILHPLQHHIKDSLTLLNERTEGIFKKAVTQDNLHAPISSSLAEVTKMAVVAPNVPDNVE